VPSILNHVLERKASIPLVTQARVNEGIAARELAAKEEKVRKRLIAQREAAVKVIASHDAC